MSLLVFLATALLHLPGEGASGIVSEDYLATDQTAGILATDLTFDPATGAISYTLPESALVRLRIGVADGGPLLRTLVDWTPRSRGVQREVWDWKDDSGRVSFSRGHRIRLVVHCRLVCSSAPDSGGSPDLPSAPGSPHAADSTLSNERADSSGAADVTVRGLRISPKFEILIPEALEGRGGAEGNEAGAVVHGITPVRVVISEADKNWIMNSQFELSFFIDGTFLAEDEEGTTPYTYLLNTKGINSGVHVLTVNVTSFDGEVGTRSIPIRVRKEG